MILLTALVTSSVVLVQVSMTPRYRSSLDRKPRLYISVISSTRFSAAAMSSFFSGGMAASQTATVSEPLVEYL